MIKKEYKEKKIYEEIAHFYCDECNKEIGWETKPKIGGYNSPLKILEIDVSIGKCCFNRDYVKKTKELCEKCYEKEKEKAIKELESIGYIKG